MVLNAFSTTFVQHTVPVKKIFGSFSCITRYNACSTEVLWYYRCKPLLAQARCSGAEIWGRFWSTIEEVQSHYSLSAVHNAKSLL